MEIHAAAFDQLPRSTLTVRQFDASYQIHQTDPGFQIRSRNLRARHFSRQQRDGLVRGDLVRLREQDAAGRFNGGDRSGSVNNRRAFGGQYPLRLARFRPTLTFALQCFDVLSI